MRQKAHKRRKKRKKEKGFKNGQKASEKPRNDDE